jgi:LacI family transcriptional regulator
MSKCPTMADVARICRVTEATVSRVLNHKTKNFSTTEAVRKRILDTTRELGYAPNPTARALSERNTRVIGLFASPQTHVAEGINESLIEGVAETLHAGGYEVFFGLSPSIRSDRKSSPSWRFDGAILMQAPKPETVAELDVRRVPYVCVNEQAGRPIACVLADDAMGMNRVISHLTQLGHKRFAYANARSTSHYSVRDRYGALQTAAQNQSIQLVAAHEMPFNSPDEFIRKAVLEQGATAVIAYEHRRAVMLLGAARGMGLRVPEDFSLVCFNDVFPVAMLHPPLTAVVVPGREIGRLGADLLLNHLLSPQPHSVKEIRVAEDLIVRDSTAPPKSDRP